MELKIKEQSWVARLAAIKLKSKAVAIVIGSTIHLYNVSRQQFLQNEKWVKHEVCHLKQFERHGYFKFILKYLWESIQNGYHENKYEKEARLAEEM
jgi:hypothetical protein